MPEIKQLSDWDKGFVQGFTAAIVTSIRDHGMETPVKSMWNCCKHTIKELKEHEVPQSDIDVLLEHWDELNYIPPPIKLI